MKRFYYIIAVILISCAQTEPIRAQELGIYLSPIGAGYSEFNYHQPEVTAPVESRGINATPNAFITLRFNRLRLGVDGSFSGVGIEDFDTPTGVQPTLAKETYWRTMFIGGGRVGFDLIQAPFFNLSPALTAGTFRALRDDFNEELSERRFIKYSLLLEFKGPGLFSLFAEPNYTHFRYDRQNASQNFTGRLYNYNLNIGVAFRL